MSAPKPTTNSKKKPRLRSTFLPMGPGRYSHHLIGPLQEDCHSHLTWETEAVRVK